jgi:hypothetical protein
MVAEGFLGLCVGVSDSRDDPPAAIKDEVELLTDREPRAKVDVVLSMDARTEPIVKMPDGSHHASKRA